ncbi:hypothetical protein ACO0QE_002386 [Hanseniaspora vineae]
MSIKTNIKSSEPHSEFNLQQLFKQMREKLEKIICDTVSQRSLFKSVATQHTINIEHQTSSTKSNTNTEELDTPTTTTNSLMSPITTPLYKRFETLVVLFHISSIFVLSIFTLFVIANPFLLFIVFLPYFIWYLKDRTPANGQIDKFASSFFRNLFIWRAYARYFPIKLHKTCDLPPSFVRSSSTKPTSPTDQPNYIFGYHPHGICALGSFGGLATNGCGFDQMFPGIKVSLLTLINNFQIPFYREYLMAAGLSSVSRKNALKLLQKKMSICIVIGGASEALHAGVGNSDLILLKRKGFVKLALEVGNVGLVPIYAFGENDVYTVVDVKEDSILHKFQLWSKRTFGFTIPIFFARGIFNYDWGLLPFRKPINLVFGKPIMIPKIEKYTQEDVDHYHALYVKELETVFEKNKKQFGYEDLNINYIA